VVVDISRAILHSGHRPALFCAPDCAYSRVVTLLVIIATESYKDLDDYLEIVAQPMNMELILDRINAGLPKRRRVCIFCC
jgi:hypothetical protein